LDKWGLHQSGKGEIYSKSAFWGSISFIVSDNFEIGEEQLTDATGQAVAPTVDHTRRLQALCCQDWISAIRKSEFEKACQIIGQIDKKIATQKQTITTPKSKVQTSRKVNTFEDEVVEILKQNYPEVSAWSSKKTVLDTFENSTMWKDWLAAGHDRAKLVNYINRLKQAYGKKDT
jgi:hypothetical protein